MRLTMVRAIDTHWQRHLTALDILREGIGLSSIGGRDPLVEYQRESFSMFNELQDEIAQLACNQIFRIKPQVAAAPLRRTMRAIHASAGEATPEQKPQTIIKKREIGRNDPCWCGSGKKYKHCHYKEDRLKEENA